MFFRDEYAFLSNMYESPVRFTKDGIPYTFRCVESAFQACKCSSRMNEFINLNGYDAKKLGRRVELRPDWEDIKVDLMKFLLKLKFNQNIILKARLANLKGDIVEHNTWGDTFWGVCNGVGENHLGKLLMDLRDSYNPFYCLVVGSRDFNDYSLMCEKLDFILKDKKYVVIVSGGAKGADSLAERYAKEHGYELKVFEAKWNDIEGLPESAIGYRNGIPYRKRAGYERNEEMHRFISVPSGHARVVVAFWNGSSKGTAHNFELATKYNNPIEVYTYTELPSGAL